MSHLNCEGPTAFCAMYRMHYPAYMKLCDLIDDAVRKDYTMATTRTSSTVGVITTPKVFCLQVARNLSECDIWSVC